LGAINRPLQLWIATGADTSAVGAINRPLQRVLCLFRRAENGVDGCAADGTLTFECGFAILHGDSLRVLHFSLCFTFDTVILIGHGEVASLHLLYNSKKHLQSLDWDVLHATSTLRIPAFVVVPAPFERRRDQERVRRVLALFQKGAQTRRQLAADLPWHGRLLDRIPAHFAQNNYAGLLAWAFALHVMP
jgi:hypothetical protein